MHNHFPQISQKVLTATVVTSMSLLSSLAQSQEFPDFVRIPPTATALEGMPTIRVASSDDGSTERTTLNANEAKTSRLLVTIVNDQFYWASRENRPLQLQQSGVFTYLYSGPGAYIKFTKIGSKIMYVEHASMFLSTLTYWGELEIVTSR